MGGGNSKSINCDMTYEINEMKRRKGFTTENQVVNELKRLITSHEWLAGDNALNMENPW